MSGWHRQYVQAGWSSGAGIRGSSQLCTVWRLRSAVGAAALALAPEVLNSDYGWFYEFVVLENGFLGSVS